MRLRTRLLVARPCRRWKSVYFSFTDFAQADAAVQTYMPALPTGSTVAPQVFYFEPQGLWYGR